VQLHAKICGWAHAGIRDNVHPIDKATNTTRSSATAMSTARRCA